MQQKVCSIMLSNRVRYSPAAGRQCRKYEVVPAGRVQAAEEEIHNRQGRIRREGGGGEGKAQGGAKVRERRNQGGT